MPKEIIGLNYHVQARRLPDGAWHSMQSCTNAELDQALVETFKSLQKTVGDDFNLNYEFRVLESVITVQMRPTETHARIAALLTEGASG